MPVKIVTNSKVWEKWATKYPPPPGRLSTPLLSIVRADGKVLDYHSGAPQGADLQRYLRRHLASAGRVLSVSQAELLARLVEQAKTQCESGDRRAAIKTLSPLRKLGPLGKLGSHAEPAVAADQLVNEWLKEFNDSLADIESRKAKEPFAALLDFVKLEETFRGFEPVKLTLAKTRKALRKEPEQRERLRAAEVIAKAQRRLEGGKSLGSSAGALRKLIDSAPDSEAAAAARKLLDQHPDGTPGAGRPPTAPRYRSWKDRSGKYQIVARLVRVEDQHVLLERKSDGNVIKVALDKLSEADRKYLREQKTSRQ